MEHMEQNIVSPNEMPFILLTSCSDAPSLCVELPCLVPGVWHQGNLGGLLVGLSL